LGRHQTIRLWFAKASFRWYFARMLPRSLPAGFIAPCLPTKADKLPSGSDWLLEGRKATLQIILAKAGAGIRFNEHMEGDGWTVVRHACKLGLEGIVSKRKDSAYRSGRSPDWLKMKNADSPAVKREAEEDWAKERWRSYKPATRRWRVR